ncbi:shikimate dehydrogenase [Thermodesulfobacteriota bacterium]
MKIDQKTKLYGLIGYPVGHSLSPAMHNTAFSETGINAAYMAFETKDPEGALKAIRVLGIGGVSVTIPHKSDVIPLLDELDDLAGKIGAVNTIVNVDGRLIGYNTDAIGALRALEEKAEVNGKSCLIAGAGGAAKAIGYILKENGVTVTICNRSAERGEALAKALGCSFIPLDRMNEIKTDILVNTTSVGMSPNIDQCIVPAHVLEEGMVVMDIIYNPLETKLLSIAKSNGCSIIDGLGMFVQQGAEQFRLWTGIDAPVKVMADSVRKML